MGRRSAEDLAAAYHRGGRDPLPPPNGLDPEARKLWRAIVASRPPDFFDAGTVPLLKAYVTLAVELDHYEAGTRLSPQYRRAVQALASLAVKLRLSVSSRRRQDDGRNDERLQKGIDALLGGEALGRRR